MKLVSQAFIFAYILTVSYGVSGFYDGNMLATFGKSFSPVENNNKALLDEARKKQKEKFVVSVLTVALIVKAVLLPLAVKAMAVMSSIAVLLSTKSLIVSSIMGYTKLAWSSTHPILKVVHVNDATWAKDEGVVNYAWGTGHYFDSLDYSSISQPEQHIHHYQK